MFKALGQWIQSVLVIALISLLVLVMGVVGFSGATLDGCRNGGVAFAAQVYGETITEGDFSAAFALPHFNTVPNDRARASRLRELTMDGLIERALLVREARRLGLAVDREEVLRRAATDEVVLLGGPVDAPPGYPAGELRQSFRDRSGNFSTENMKSFIQYQLRRSVDEFTSWQVDETLAARVRDLVASTVVVGRGEVWNAYVEETERARVNYVRFKPSFFRDRVDMGEAAVAAWTAEHSDEVDQAYERQKYRYTNLPLQVRTRNILVEVAAPGGDGERAAAMARAEAILRRARAGADFATLARENSDDEETAERGGDAGYRAEGSLPYDEAAFAAEVGAVVDRVVETPVGLYVVKVEGRREGDVPVAEAKQELASDLYRTSRAAAMAKTAAEAALARWREGPSSEALAAQIRTDLGVTEGTDESRLPQVESSRSFGRSERAIDGPFNSGPLTAAAFEMSLEDPLPAAPLQMGEEWVIFRLEERTEATQQGFDEAVRRRLGERLRQDKEREALSVYVHGLRAAAEELGALQINRAILRYGEEATGDDPGSAG